MMYRASGVGVRIGGATLLDDVSVEIRPGEVVAVAGPNGAGKSTLVSVLAGDREPSSGSVSLEERALADWPRFALARRRAVIGAAGGVAVDLLVRVLVVRGRCVFEGGDS